MGMAKLVLAADDNPVVLSLLELSLIKAGFAVQVVEDGAAVLTCLTSVTPDLIILDLEMPCLGGLEALRRIKQAPPLMSIPVMMLTASDDDADIVRAHRLGASGYMAKPFEPDDLVQKVHALLDGQGVVWMDDYTSVTNRRAG